MGNSEITNEKYSTDSGKDAIYILALVMLGLSIVVAAILLIKVAYTYYAAAYVSGNFNHVLSNEQANNIIEQLTSMQANTLAVTGLCISAVSIVLGALTFLRERKMDSLLSNYRQELNSLLRKQNEINRFEERIIIMENTMNTLMSIHSNFLFGLKDGQYYYDSIVNEAKKLKADKVAPEYCLSYLSIAATIAVNQGKHESAVPFYEDIVHISKAIVEDTNKPSFSLKYAYMEGLSALYKLIRYQAQNHPLRVPGWIDTANDFIEGIQALETEDSFGYKENMEGLICFWSTFAKSNDMSKDELLLKVQEAISHYDIAISLNRNKVEFINHRLVARIKEYELTHSNDVFEIAVSDIEKMKFIDESYYKLNHNEGNLYLKKAQHLMGISDLPFVFSEVAIEMENKNSINIKEIVKLIDNAEISIKRAIKLAPTFSENYYKLAEVLIFKLFVSQFPCFQPLHLKKRTELAKDIEIYLDNSEMMDATLLGHLFIKRNYYELINNIQEAKKVNTEIAKRDYSNSVKWLKKAELYYS